MIIIIHYYFLFLCFSQEPLPVCGGKSEAGSMTSQISVKVLDGGWGWVIVMASFMAQFLAYGSPQSVGVLYPEWLSAFQEGKGMTAWVGSLVSGVGLIASE